MFARDWVSYKNGNYTVFINLRDGTKVRYNKLDTMEAYFPESVDVNITDCCDMGCRFCFLPDETIKTGSGVKDICDIHIGDMVWSFNHSTNDEELDVVEEVYERDYCGDVICIELEDGSIIKCTPNHQFFDGNKYICASDIVSGMDLKRKN